jgi:hypothetical protein
MVPRATTGAVEKTSRHRSALGGAIVTRSAEDREALELLEAVEGFCSILHGVNYIYYTSQSREPNDHLQ